MTGSIFLHTLKRQWKQILWWGLGVGMLGFIQVIFVQDSNLLSQMSTLMESIPPFFMDMLGASDIEFMATPEGYLSLQFFSLLLIIFAVYGVMAGLNVTANEEDRGIMDVMLSLPLPRWRVIAEKSLAYTVIVAGIITLTFLCMWGGILATPALSSVSITRIAEATYSALPGTLLVMAFTALAAVVLRRKGTATAVAATFVTASYFLDTLGRASGEGSLLNQLRALSFHTYYDGTAVMQYGISWGNIILILVVTVVLLGGSLFAFQRRDVGL